MKKMVWLAALVLWALPCFGQQMWVLTEEYKPFQFFDENGKPAGFGIELVTAMYQKAGIGIKNGVIDILPWSRTYKYLLANKNAAAFLTTRNNAREKMFKWVGPLAPRRMWLYKLAKRDDIQIKSIAEAKAYTVGGYKSSQTDYLEALEFPHLLIVPQQKQNIRLLLRERVDLIPSLEPTIASRLKNMGMSLDVVEKAVLFDARFDYYLAVNIQTDDLLVNRLQAALNDLKADGTYDRIKQKYWK